MKAVICRSYGPPEVLAVEEVERPVPGEKDVLVRIRASAVNSGDVRVRGLVVGGFLRLVMRLVLGFRGPRRRILGLVLAGVVEEVGAKVTRFRPGDEVFASTGLRFGGHAEYITLPESGTVLHKPRNLSFEESAAILFGGMTALYFLRKGGLDTGKGLRVLIYGASGSVGTAAIQIAAFHGAEVTAVCGPEGMNLGRSLGSHRQVDYTSEAFTRLAEQYDIVFDAVGKTSRRWRRSMLRPGGRELTVGGLDTARETTGQMEELKRMSEGGHFRATIDRVYPLESIREAHRYVDSGRKKGNVVIQMP